MKIQILKKDSHKSFSYLAGINRPINPSQVTKLAESIKTLGILRPIVVAELQFISGKLLKYIIDGQHAFNALLRNNMDIPYVTIKIDNKVQLVESIALLNASSKNWTLLDYITSWSCVSEDYKKLLHYYNVYDLELGNIAVVLMERNTDNGNITKAIKRGQFKVVNEEKNVKILDCLTDVLSILPRMNRFENKYVCSEYVQFYRKNPDYNHQQFLTNLKKKRAKFILATQEPTKLSEMFQELAK